MANKVILGGTDVVKQYEEDSMSHSEEVKYKTMKKQKQKKPKKQLRDWSRRMKTEKALLGLARNKPPALFSHRVRRRERSGTPLGREPSAPCYAPCFPKKYDSLKDFQNLLRHLPWICKFYHKLCFSSWENILFLPFANSPHIYLPTGSLFVQISPYPRSDLLSLSESH